jgi:hypothetical protein
MGFGMPFLAGFFLGRYLEMKKLNERLRPSLRHPKNYIALQRLLGCRHFNKASGRANRYGGF